MLDADVRQCFIYCMAVNITDASWCQAQLPLHLGVWDFSPSPIMPVQHYSSSGWLNNEDAHLNRAIDMFNE